MKKFFTLLVMMVITIIIYSQVPQKLSYQAVIRNSSGQLVTNHAVGMKISILQGSATGTLVYSETYSPVPQTNANGLVTIEIGGGTAVTGLFSSINWSSGIYYLKTEADPAGGTNYNVVGTSPLLSVPSSLYSDYAGNIKQYGKTVISTYEYSIALGAYAMWWSGPGIRNTALGYSAQGMGSSTAEDNIAVGCFALNNNKGQNNIALGTCASEFNYLSSENIAIGNRALQNNKASMNIAVGTEALHASEGGSNIAMGYKVLWANTSGFYNTAFGRWSLWNNSTGNNNTALGIGTLSDNTTGNSNTALGVWAGNKCQTGNNNVFIGFESGYYEAGSNKLFIDNQRRANETDARIKALVYGVFDASPANQYLNINGNTSISGNTTIKGNTTVTGNLQVGSSFGPITSNWWEFGTDTNNGTAIDFHSNTSSTDYSSRIYRLPGNNAEFQVVNAGTGNLGFYTANTPRMAITGSGNVGIGTTAPNYMLDVNGEITSRSTSVSSFRLRGTSYSTFLRNDGSDFYILLTNAGNPDGSWNTLRPFSINLSTGNTYLGGQALTVNHGGNVGIGTTTPGTKLAISGLTGSTAGSTLIINGGNIYFLGSTRDIKDNIHPLDDDFSKILNATPVAFTDKATGMAGIGYIAEDFEDAGLQNLLVYENGKLVSLRYDLVSVYNLEIIKDLHKHLKSVEEENQTLRAELDELKADMNKLKRKLR